MHSDPEIQRLRDEVDKLGRVITEVMGAEFDTIMTRQNEDQRSAMRWIATSMALNVACVELLLERGLLEREDVMARVAEVRKRLLTHVEAMGSDAEIADWFGDLTGSGEGAAEP
ncbi:MAG TPA: hypothetical protein VNM87_14010 [Candidatus Udaeobacter sp.]|nr:hypothetical protein [Candidatus Udaeobacter sp.]